MAFPVPSIRFTTVCWRSTFPAILIVGLSAGATNGFAREHDSPLRPAPINNKSFIISHWSFPKDELQLKRFAQAGFNTVIATPEELPACRRHGWQALLAVSPGKEADFVHDPIVWGYFLFDEPARKSVGYDTFVDRMTVLHKLDPHRPAYINLNEKDDPEAFVKILKPRVLSYDYYQWWATPEPFFPLLEKFRRAALQANIPLLCWTEAVTVPQGPIPADNEAKIRHSVYSALAYGAKGIQWWAWRENNQDAEKINAELKMLGPVLMTLRSVDVFHTAPLPPQTRPIPQQSWVKSTTESLTLGLFKNEQGEDFILAANRDWKAPRTAELVFSTPVSTVSMLDRKTGQWADLKLHRSDCAQSLSRVLPPGDGILLRVIRPRN